MSVTKTFQVWWDTGKLDCRCPKLQKKFQMTMSEIINADPEWLEEWTCRLYGLPRKLNEVQLKRLLRSGKNGFKIYGYIECN